MHLKGLEDLTIRCYELLAPEVTKSAKGKRQALCRL